MGRGTARAVEIQEAAGNYRAIGERQSRRKLEGGESSRRRLPYGNLFPSSSTALLAEGQSVPVISFSSRKGEAGKRTASTSSGLAEPTPRRRGRNTQYNLNPRADILVPFSPLGRKPRVPSGALLGWVLDEVGG
jgi:hypothetical protein